jgi:hypothetical protein
MSCMVSGGLIGPRRVTAGYAAGGCLGGLSEVARPERSSFSGMGACTAIQPKAWFSGKVDKVLMKYLASCLLLLAIELYEFLSGGLISIRM